MTGNKCANDDTPISTRKYVNVSSFRTVSAMSANRVTSDESAREIVLTRGGMSRGSNTCWKKSVYHLVDPMCDLQYARHLPQVRCLPWLHSGMTSNFPGRIMNLASPTTCNIYSDETKIYLQHIEYSIRIDSNEESRSESPTYYTSTQHCSYNAQGRWNSRQSDRHMASCSQRVKLQHEAADLRPKGQ